MTRKAATGKRTRAGARAYSSTANLGPGFDVFGLALDAFYDEVFITRRPGTKGAITITNLDTEAGHETPTDPGANTAGLVVDSMLKRHKITDDVEVAIRKGVPAGRGLGSSAASAAATAVACDRLYGLNQTEEELVRAAGEGERASAGTVHYDNVAASLLGGFVIVRPSPLKVAKFTPARGLWYCVAIPEIDVPEKKTKVSRGVLPKNVPLKDSVQNLANAALLATSLATNNGLLGSGITTDVIAEPARKHAIPGLDRTRELALRNGAKEVMISGAGPTLISIMSGRPRQRSLVEAAMRDGFGAAGVKCQTIICRAAPGAREVPEGRT